MLNFFSSLIWSCFFLVFFIVRPAIIKKKNFNDTKSWRHTRWVNGHAKSYQTVWRERAGGGAGCLQMQSKSYRTFFNVLLCIRFKLRQALTLLFSVFVKRFYKGKIYLNMRTRLIKMKVLASNSVLVVVLLRVYRFLDGG